MSGSGAGMAATGRTAPLSTNKGGITAAGGPGARLGQGCIRKVGVLEYPELGMEAVWRIEVENFPAFIVVGDKGNDFFSELKL